MTTQQHPHEERTEARRRFGMRVTLLMVALFLAAVPFTALLLLVRRHWGPLESLDNGAADRLHTWVLGSPGTVHLLDTLTNAGGPGPMRIVAVVLAGVLFAQRKRRLAAYVLTTVAVAAVLSYSLKSLVGRSRPVFEEAVARAPGASFPSGHALTSFVVVGLVGLILLPRVRRPLWAPLIAVGVLFVLAIGFSRVALGVHYVSDVLGGWVIGAACLAAVTAAFHIWREETPDDREDDEIAVG